MLSLGSNISATQAVESKYSASFDGTGDFIDLGNSDDIISTSQANVTLMCWVKPEEEASNQYIFTNKRTNSSSNFSLRIYSDSGIKFNALIYTGTGLSTTLYSTTTVTAGTWYHVAVTAKANEQKIYINGQLEHTLTLAFGMSPSATDECTIGSFGSGNEYEGLISELAIFNACLTGNAVLAAYNSGFDLKTNVGDYTNSSDITHYYKMGDGFFDDKANGIIHDQDNPGFGNDLITNGDFSNGLTGFDSNNVTIVNGAAKIDNTGDGAIAFVSTDSAVGTVGDVYKLIYDVTITNGKTLTIEGDTNNDLETDTVGVNRVKYFVFNKSTGKLVVKRKTSGTNVTIDNLRLFKLNGNPGITSGGVTFSSSTP
tara:strand:+ start:425 stop:1534 length:1110 start_codon:yes stop_codon:yes gene_type:complete